MMTSQLLVVHYLVAFTVLVAAVGVVVVTASLVVAAVRVFVVFALLVAAVVRFIVVVPSAFVVFVSGKNGTSEILCIACEGHSAEESKEGEEEESSEVHDRRSAVK